MIDINKRKNVYCSVTICWLMPDESPGLSLLDLVAEKAAVVPSFWSLEIDNVLLIA